MDADWARSVVAECVEREVLVFGKQWGCWPNNPLAATGAKPDADPHGKGGALLDGRLWREAPEPELPERKLQKALDFA